jgi:cobalt-zinc-cadmium efflux system outer membrane protein
MASISAKTRADAEANAVERVTKARLMVAMERFSTMRSAWTDWEKIGPLSVGVQTNLLTRLWEAREISMSDFLLQYRQTLVAQKTAAELRQTLWNAWIDYLEETNQVESWLSDAAFVDGSVAGERKL